MTQHLRICLVKKLVSDTVVNCLESTQFLNQREIFHFPEEYQSLRNHPAIAGLPEVIKILRSMKEVNTYRYMKIALPENQRPLYLDDNGNFKFAGQLLQEGPDRSRITTHGPQNGEINQNVACTFEDIGCTFEGTRRALDHHLATAATSHLSLTTALVMKQRLEMRRLEMKIARQQEKISRQRAESQEQRGEIDSQKTKIYVLSGGVLDSTVDTHGDILWKIYNYADLLKEAKSKMSYFIYTPPFLTAPNGYKLRGISYLNGVGEGEGTHLSILIQLLPGESDSILSWPFTMNVTFTLLDRPENPDEAFHKTACFVPDTANKSFQRPSKYSLLKPHGFIRFIPHEILRTRHYVKDDAVFIRIKIG